MCFHNGLINISDWGCGYANASVGKLRTSFNTFVQPIERLVGPARCNLEPVLRVQSVSRGHSLVTPQLRHAVDDITPNTSTVNIPAALLRVESEESSDDGRSTASAKTKADPLGGDPWVNTSEDEMEDLPTATTIAHPKGPIAGAGGSVQVATPDVTQSSDLTTGAGSSSSMLRPWDDQLVTPVSETNRVANSHLYSDEPWCLAARPKAAALGPFAATPKASPWSCTITDPTPPPPGCRHTATQTHIAVCGTMMGKHITFNMWGGPTVTDLQAHVNMCRYIEWQQTIQAKQETLAELGMSATHIRRLMEINTEAARRARTEQMVQEGRPIPKPKPGPSARTIRRANNRATKRAARQMQAEQEESQDQSSRPNARGYFGNKWWRPHANWYSTQRYADWKS